MRRIVGFGLLVSKLCWADSIYIIGADNSSSPVYWSIIPPATAGSPESFDLGMDPNGSVRSIAVSPSQLFYVVGDSANDDFTRGVYWTIPNQGMASNVNDLTASTDSATVNINAVAFNSSGEGYIVGKNADGNAAYWTISSLGVVSSPTALAMGSFPGAVAFSTAGNGLIAGLDVMNNLSYWTISLVGAVDGPFGLVGGEMGGAASVYAVTFDSSGTAYIGGANTSGVACYWTVSSMGVASAAVELDSGSNGQLRGIAFYSSGDGIFVGQSASNNSSYWALGGGSAGMANNLPNGAGGGSSANGVVISSDGTAYIVGLSGANQAVYWTLPTLSGMASYHLLDSGGFGIANAIAIYFATAPNPPSNLSASFLINDFGLVYEYAASLNWTASSSDNVAGYNVYKNGVRIGSVDSSMTYYDNHDQSRSAFVQYGVSAFDQEGNESSQATVSLN